MKGTKDKMEVDGTKLQLVAAVFPQENKRKRAEAQKKKRQSVSYLAIAQRVRSLATQDYSVLSTTPSNTSEKVGRRE